MLTVRYFASIREKAGFDEEQLPMTEETQTVSGLRRCLAQRSAVWADLLGEEALVMAAVNEEMVSPHSRLDDGDVVAFFPPVTGG